MKKKTSTLLAGALVTGLIAGTVAMADTAQTEEKPADDKQVSGTKNGCSGKTAEGKNSCSVKKDKKVKKSAKNKCAGKNGCGEKEEGK